MNNSEQLDFRQKIVVNLYRDSEMGLKVVRRRDVSGWITSGKRQTDADCRNNKTQTKKNLKKGKAYGSKKSTIRNQHS